MAEIVCLEDCQFLVLDRKTFNASIRAKQNELMNRELFFVQNIPFMK